MIIGVANRGGVSRRAGRILLKALDLAWIWPAAAQPGRAICRRCASGGEHGRTRRRAPSDARVRIGTGSRRPGKRLLAVGTDCSIGKMYTALALEKEMRARGFKADFRATGQTGILIAGDGVSIDAVVSDFVSGAVESLRPQRCRITGMWSRARARFFIRPMPA